MTLIFEELKRLGEWKPYRETWDFTGKLSTRDEEEVEEHYNRISRAFLHNPKFDCIQNQDGGMSNYLSFLCCQPKSYGLHIDSIIVFIHLYAPIGTYGQGSIFIQETSHGWTDPPVSSLGIIRNIDLKDIEAEITSILSFHGIEILENEWLNEDLRSELTITENLNDGNKMFNYLFQWVD